MGKNMLKIKDNVDLNELKNFGFQYNNFGFYSIRVDLPYGEQKLYIDEDTRDISIVGAGEELLVNLFDLIQAGLVEKWCNNGRKKLKEYL